MTTTDPREPEASARRDAREEAREVPVLVEEGELALARPILARGRARLGMTHDHPSYRWWVLFAVLSGVFATGLTITVITAAAPFIRDDFDVSRSAVSWVIVAPFLFRSVFVPAFGKLGDRFGRRRVWAVGFGVSTVASLACGFAPSFGALVVFRAIAAAAGAAVIPSALALISDAFPPEDRVKALGWWSATIAVAPLVGVIVGGFVVQGLSWRWLFYLQFPFAAFALWLGLLVLRESYGRTDQRFDLLGALLSVVGLGALMLVLNQGVEWGWTSPPVLLSAAVGVVLLTWFVLHERRVEAPVIPIEYFARRRFTASVAANFFANFSYMGGYWITSLMLADLWGYAPAAVALAIAPRAASLGVMGPIGGYASARFGGRRMAVTGMVLILLSMLTLAVLQDDAPYWALLPGLVLSGFGLGLVAPPTSAAVTNEARPDDLAAVSGALNMGGSIGSSIGIATMTTVLTIAAADAASPAASAYHASFLFGAGVCVLGLVAAWFVPRHLTPGTPAADDPADPTAPPDGGEPVGAR